MQEVVRQRPVHHVRRSGPLDAGFRDGDDDFCGVSKAIPKYVENTSHSLLVPQVYYEFTRRYPRCSGIGRLRG